MKRSHALTLSIMIHLLLVLSLKVIYDEGQLNPPPPKKNWLEFKDENRGPIMSDSNKRVKRQTRTKESQPSTLSSLTPPTPSAPNHSPQKNVQTSENTTHKGSALSEALHSQTFEKGDVYFKPNPGGAISAQARQQLQSFLPKDLELGDVVALNTDQDLFYTFYRRMAEKVIWPWAQNVMGGFEKLRMQGQLGATSKAWITVVEVILDKDGNLVSTQPMQLSGMWEIDSAPTKAFKQAKNFPNPPTEMVEEDGYIHIRYKFIVYYNPKSQF